MKIIIRIAVVAVIVGLLSACATSSKTSRRPVLKIHGLFLAKDVEQIGDRGLPVNPATSFSVDDKQVVALLRFENLAGFHRLTWRWYNPRKVLHRSSEALPVYIPKNKYSRSVTAWHALDLAADGAADLPGQWEVRVYAGKELIRSKLFMLTESTAQRSSPQQDVWKVAAAQPDPLKWALIIGDQDDAGASAGPAIQDSAGNVADHFERALGIPPENIIALTRLDAGRKRIQALLKTFFPDVARQQGQLFVYFTGRAFKAQKDGRTYLLAGGKDATKSADDAYALSSFLRDIDGLAIKQACVFLDAVIDPAKPADLNAIRLIRTIVFAAGGLAPFEPVGRSNPDYGDFKDHLLRALRSGQADANQDRGVNAGELYDYLRRNLAPADGGQDATRNPWVLPDLDKVKDLTIYRISHLS